MNKRAFVWRCALVGLLLLAPVVTAQEAIDETGEKSGSNLWLFVVLSVVVLLVLLEVAWIYVPFFFHLYGSPKLDGAYRYSKSDFLPDGKTPKKTPLSNQENRFVLEFDESLPEYRVRFGDERTLAGGKVRLMSKGEWYSSSPESGEKRILFKKMTETTERGDNFQGMEGDFKRLSVEWTLEGESVPITTHFDLYQNCTIRVFEPDLRHEEEIIQDLNFILFSVAFPSGLQNCSAGSFETLSVNFPCFINESPNQRMLTFKDSLMAPPSRDVVVTSGPRLFFDDDLNTFLISSTDEFMIHLTSVIGANIAAGLNGEIEHIEPNYKSRTMLIFDRGINRSFERFGDLLRCLHGKNRKSMYMDVATSYIGYWTDNGAYYYYNPMKGKKLSQTLVEVSKHIEEMDLPIQYYNIDSWWYQKSVSAWKRRWIGNFGRIVGGGLYGGALTYERDPYHMHVPVDELSRILGKPFVAHHRWFHTDTPYKEEYDFYIEKNRLGFWAKLIRGYDDKSICLERDLWDRLMADCPKWNIAVWEQDWLEPQFRAFSMLRNRTGNADKWITNMGEAAADHGVTIQYALSSAGMNLTSVKLNAVSYARTAQDYHPRWPRSYDFKPFAQSNILAYALRLWPFKDVFRSTCEGVIKGEKMPEFMALVSTLSCGPVGVGDKIGNFGKDTIMRACRKDGLILKPDKPLTAADSMFVPNAKYFLCTTHSEISGKRWEYIVINKLDILYPKDRSITKQDIGITEDKVAYNYFKKEFQVLDDRNPFEDRIKRRECNYWIAAPMLQKGFAIIGDISKYTTMSFKEFLSLDVHDSRVNLRVENIAGETVRLLMYDQDKIRSIEVDGEKIEKTPGHLCHADSIPAEGPTWVFDESMKASVLVFRFGEDGTKDLSIELAGPNLGVPRCEKNRR